MRDCHIQIIIIMFLTLAVTMEILQVFHDEMSYLIMVLTLEYCRYSDGVDVLIMKKASKAINLRCHAISSIFLHMYHVFFRFLTRDQDEING